MNILLTDKEVAEALSVSTRTLYNMIHNPPKEGININEVEQVQVGGRRRWVKASLEKCLGIKEGE